MRTIDEIQDKREKLVGRLSKLHDNLYNGDTKEYDEDVILGLCGQIRAIDWILDLDEEE